MSETVLKVGSHEQFTTINAAILAAVAAGGNADIQVDAGIYYNDGGYVTDGINNVTIEGVGGVAVIVDPGYNAGGKAAIVTGGDNIVLKNLDISEVQVSDGNGAAVRYEQGTLVLDNVHFHDNQNGILGGPDPTGSITITNSELDHNGIDGGDGHTHDLYIGDIANFTIQNSYIHDANLGHEIKSRAQNTVIMNNVIADNLGTASYDIDLPNGGNATITGNTIEQGPNTQNSSINAYGEEGASNAGNTVVFSNNTVVNDGPNGPLWTGGGATVSGTGNTLYNVGSLGIATGLSDTQTATARPAVTGTTFQDVLPAYTGTDTITVNLSEDQYQGDALATIYVDGQALARDQTVTANHGLGQTEAFTYQVAAAPSHVVSAQFENAAQGSDSSTGRNLYIDGVSVNGGAIPSTAASEQSDQTVGFQVPGSGSDAPAPPQGEIDPVTGATLPTIEPGLHGNFSITNPTLSLSGSNDGTVYSGPVAGLESQFIWGGSQGVAAAATTPNVFLKGGGGNDALQVASGSNVLDGAGGSNWLVGATGTDGGHDTFFVDDRGMAGPSWTTIINFHVGDMLTVWGFVAGTSSQSWVGVGGAANYTGATLQAAVNGNAGSITFAGMSVDQTQGLSQTSGTIGDQNYLLITRTS